MPKEGTQESKTGRVKDTMQRYHVGRDTARKLAEDAGAVIKYGKVRLHDFEKIDNYLSQLAGRG